MENIAAMIIPLILAAMSIMFFSDRSLYEDFISGAKNGIQVSIKLLPTLILLLVGVGMFTSSGAVDLLTSLLSPICDKIGVPSEALPLIILRPISGSASIAMANDLFLKYSPDSFAGQVISVIMGSSDTIIYVAAVYFSSVGIKKTRHALPCAFLTMFFCIFLSCLCCRIFFS